MANDFKKVYQKVDIKDIIAYYVRGFTEEVVDYEYFIDISKSKIIFELFVKE